ncbi:hypothetical protein AK830_g2100 [Neonectria ditissima]|uniref:Protein kinase domain-containing protein n=1 Tax=Neonectria ditissima TaxID=78410 RepID=A0A0P7BST4_9HYPO|nr:hypothetical protein AK830_g2100 [Neonectria ditissima]
MDSDQEMAVVTHDDPVVRPSDCGDDNIPVGDAPENTASPILSYPTPRAVLHYDLSSNEPLPFSEAAETKTFKGGFGIVRRVVIHPNSHAYDPGTASTPKFFAVKQLVNCKGVEESFKREAEVLKTFASLRHPHLIRLLGTYRTDESYHLIFPWADGNLRSFWKISPKPVPNCTSICWMIEQLRGLASGLTQIHNLNRGSGKKRDEQLIGRHGDIKPENILWFRNSETGIGTLQIADFGTAELHRDNSSESSVFKLRGYSPTYRAPEVDLGNPVSRAYDIWSLGCVFLEAATWCLRGSEDIDNFANARASTVPKNGKPDDSFFELFANDPGGKPRAKVKSSVSEWINGLRSKSDITNCLHDFLDFTETEMLETDPKKRATSPDVVSKLDSFKEKCQNDPEYTKPKPPPRKPPWRPAKPKVVDDRHIVTYRRPHTISVNMVRLPAQHTTRNTVPVATQPTNASTTPYFDNGFGNGSSATSLSMPFQFEPSHSIAAGNDSLRQNTRSSQLPFSQASGAQSSRAPTTRKRKIESFNGSLEEEFVNGTDRATFPKFAGSVSSEVPRGRRRDRGPAQRQCDGSEMPAHLPVKEKPETLFACPYYQRDCEKYGTTEWKSCIGPGWTIPRLKEHLYRRHLSGTFRCQRCFAEFETADQHTSHLRSEIPCFRETAVQSPDTIDESQRVQIQKRLSKKPSPDKWNEMYRIIFPFDPPEAIPSPYWEEKNPSTYCNEGNNQQKSCSGPSLAAFQDYLTDRMRADDINMDVLEDIAGCQKLIKAFNRSSNHLTELTTSSDAPSLVHDTVATTATQSSLTTATSLELDPPLEMLGGTSIGPEKPPDWLSFLDDLAFNDANDECVMNWA